jgi:hypothetical protein
MPASRDEKARQLLAGMLKLSDADGTQLVPQLYTPDGVPQLIAKMAPLVELKRAKKLPQSEEQELGYMLEDLGLLIFQGLAGLDSFKSYKSADAQLDLVVSGPDLVWREITKILHIKEYSSILVEAKAKTGKVSVAEFLRLGSLLTHHCGSTSGLGVFLSIEGASGFPKRGGKMLALKDARVTQLILHHSIRKPIVVLDWDDIKELDRAGSLITMLRRKIQEIEAMSGEPTPVPSAPVEVLPERLKKLLRKDLGGSRD